MTAPRSARPDFVPGMQAHGSLMRESLSAAAGGTKAVIRMGAMDYTG
ncbi:MAG TPA: hypothetical protein VMI47_00080 [Pseudolabrys sp.]|nr:hypothetical protein [Pseudolabrys sp.]